MRTHVGGSEKAPAACGGAGWGLAARLHVYESVMPCLSGPTGLESWLRDIFASRAGRTKIFSQSPALYFQRRGLGYFNVELHSYRGSAAGLGQRAPLGPSQQLHRE